MNKQDLYYEIEKVKTELKTLESYFKPNVPCGLQGYYGKEYKTKKEYLAKLQVKINRYYNIKPVNNELYKDNDKLIACY